MTSESTQGWTLVQELVVPAREGRSLRVEAGDRLTIVNVEGQQIADFVAVDARDFANVISVSKTRWKNLSLRLKPGHRIVSDRWDTMFEVVEDTVGVHDLLFPPCDPPAYQRLKQPADHPSCWTNLRGALATQGYSGPVPDPVNFFQNTPADAEGRLLGETSPARPGDYVTLEARIPAVVAVSACPFDAVPINGERITDIALRVTRRSP